MLEHRPDVVLMDIRMPGMDGLGHLAPAAAAPPAVHVKTHVARILRKLGLRTGSRPG